MEQHSRFSPNCRLLNRTALENEPLDIEHLNKTLPVISVDISGTTEMHTVIEGTVNPKEIERLEHEKMKEYLKKYGYRLIKK